MIICRCEKCKKLLTFKSGETLKCKCGGEVYLIKILKGVQTMTYDANIDYAEKLYRCIQAHTSQAGWEPDAAASASASTTKASEASTSATNASNSADTASTKASQASTSATNASNSASSASTSATNASTSASDAATAKTAAETAATNAQTAETNAETAADGAYMPQYSNRFGITA